MRIDLIITKLILIISLAAVVTVPVWASKAEQWRAKHTAGVNAYKAKQYKQAQTELLDALKLAKKAFKKKPEHANTLYYLALTKMRLDRTREAVPLLNLCLKIRKRKLGINHPDTQETIETLAAAHIEMEQPQYALPILRDLLAHRRKEHGEKHNLTISVKEKLGRVLAAQENYAEALPMYREAIDVSKKNGAKQAYLAGMYKAYATMLRKSGKTKKARVWAERADEIFAVVKEQARIDADNKEVIKETSATVVQGKTKAKKPYKDPNGFTQFRTNLVNQHYTVSQQYMHTLCRDKRTFTNLSHCIVYWFQSRNRTRTNIYPRLTLRLFEYTDAASAGQAISSLGNAAKPDTGINYEWNYVVANGKWVYWMNAGCVYSKDKWGGMVSRLQQDMGIADDSALAKMTCKCGGGCTKPTQATAPAPTPAPGASPGTGPDSNSGSSSVSNPSSNSGTTLGPTIPTPGAKPTPRPSGVPAGSSGSSGVPGGSSGSSGPSGSSGSRGVPGGSSGSTGSFDSANPYP